MDKLLAIRVFVRVVEAGTFTRAADSLQMPKATVTKLIQSLEDQLRVKLLQRTTRRVTVTAEGAEYYERTRELLHDLDETDASVAKMHVHPSGRLRIDVGGALARMLLVPALPAFHSRYPDIQIELGVSDRNVDMVGDNVDCVLRAGPLSENTWISRRVAELQFITCASPDYLERHGTPAHPSELDRDHLVAAYFSAHTRRLVPLKFTRGEDQIEIQGRFVVAVNDSTSQVDVALAGLGVLQTATFIVEPHLIARRLVGILSNWQTEPKPIYAIYSSRPHVSARVRVFVEWVAGIFAQNRLTRPR